MSGIHQLLLGGSVQQAVDPYFYSVTSLLHGDGTNGGQNNTFLDSSTNNFTITRNGNTTQGSFSPFSQTGWGNYFDGTGDYLTVADNAALEMGSSNFTIECWFYPLSLPADALIADFGSQGAQGSLIPFYCSSSNVVYYISSGGGTWNIASGVSFGGTLRIGQWHHLALVRSGSTFTPYFNGVAGTTTTNASAINDAAVNKFIGSATTGTAAVNGYISNFRVVKGTAVYTANFTPPTTPLTAITNTSLLTCQANRFLDASSNAFAITANGNVSVQPFSPFNPLTPYSTSAVGGSGYFDGSGDYLSVADAAAMELGSGNWTIEMWVNTTNSTAYSALFARDDGGTTAGSYVILLNGATANGIVSFWSADVNSFGAAVLTSGTANCRDGAWHHIAVVRNSNTLTMYIDGTSTSTATFTGAFANTAQPILIGAETGYSRPYTGYMANIRLVIGTAVYTANFTPPTAPLTAISNTQLLLNFTNAGIFDNAADADYETVGNAQISTSVKKYGTGSMLFDGTGDYLTTPYSQSINFGTGDFTIEGWFYLNSFANQYYVLGGTWTTGTTDEWLIQIENNGSLRFLTTANTSFFATGLIKTGTWYHFAASRNAGVIKAYINGSVFATITNANSIGSVSKTLNIGQQPGGTWPWNGYLDDWRVTKGIGRYPYNFTPPTAEFPNIGGTVTLTADPYFDYTTLLLPGNGTNGAQNNTFLDSSTNNFTITRNGNTTQGTFSPFSQTGWGNYFDGSGDYLSVADNAALDIPGDFTIEFWVNVDSGNTDRAGIIGHRDASGFTDGTDWAIRVETSVGKIGFGYGSSGVYYDMGSYVVGEWAHYAITRSGTTIRTFKNGTQVATATNNSTWSSTAEFLIGRNISGFDYKGFLSNVRLVKGTAVYTSNFTPSTTPLTAISGTSLLTCQSNRFIDNSTNAFAITRNGNVSVQAFSPFNPTAAWSALTNGGSGYFDGSGDYLTVPDNAALQMGSGDFTIEYWWYPNNITGYQNPIDKGYSGAGAFLLQTGNGDGRILVIASGSIVITSSTAVTVNAWNHMAVVRSGTTLTLYQNGVSVGSATNSTNFNNTTQLGIGATGAPVIGSFPVVGFLSGVRFVKGTAVYSGSTYTVPTAPPTAITNTSLLLNYTNAGIYDATSKNDLETVGNAQISTTQSKFGGSSMYFDGTGDWLLAPNNAIYDFGTGDFTIEFWARFDSVGSFIYFITEGTGINGAPNLKTAGWSVIYTSPNLQLQRYDGSTQTIYSFAWTPATGTWYHVAMSRYASSLRCFINGSQIGTTQTSTDSFNRINTTDPLTIGTGVSGGSPGANYSFNGYMQDIRLTKGIARYTSNFTPPTTAFLTL